MKLFKILCISLLTCTGSMTPVAASAQALPSMVNKYFFDKDPPHGALIFQQRRTQEAAAFRKTTGSFYTHVGIIRVTGGGPYVMQSSVETDGVEEVPLDEFINAGANQEFAIYVGTKDIRPNGHLNHPASDAAYAFYHAPYDRFFQPGTSAFYSAELIFELFRVIEHPIGKETTLAELISEPAVDIPILIPDWLKHPNCVKQKLDATACLDFISRMTIIMPDSLANDPELRLYLTTFNLTN